MTPARAIAGGGLLVAVVIVGLLLLRGGDASTYKLRFQNAGQLVKDDDVQVGGRRVGSIREIELTDGNEADITIEVQDEFAPLHSGTTALIRATSLSGVANRYVALTPGANSGPELKDGALLKADVTTSIVDLDQLFNTLDPGARKSLQQVIKGSRDQFDGVGPQANEAARYFNPALSTTSRLARELTRDNKTFQDFVVNSSKVVSALADRREDLSGLVTNANRTAAAIGTENAALSRAGAPAADAAQGQHDLREPARHAGRPGRAGRGVQARDPPAGAVPARAAAAGRQRPPDDPRPAPARAANG